MLRKFIEPHIIISITVISSFIAWVLPTGSRKGFHYPETIHSGSVSLLILWYGLIILGAALGFKFGKRIKPIPNLNVNTIMLNTYMYYILTILGILGVLFTYLTIFINNPRFIDDVINANANQLKYALYDNYSQVTHSLRYLTILSGTISVTNLLLNKRTKVDILNILALVLTALVSSRLAILMLLVLLTCNLIKNNFKIKRIYLAIVAILSITLLTFFNYSRNANFYKDVHNIDNPIIMNFAEIITYMGAPVQATLGVFNNMTFFNKTPNIKEIIYFFVPETFHKTLGLETNFISNFREFVDLERSLTTNSAAVSLIDSIGYYSFFVIFVTIIVYSIFIGHFINYKNMLSFISYVVLYCVFEIWRTFLFNQGIIHTLILGLVFSYIVALIFCNTSKIKIKNRGNYEKENYG